MKGNIPWNKDKTNIYSEETLKKMSKSKQGMYQGENNPMFGKEGYWKNKKRPDHGQKVKRSLRGKYLGEEHWNFGRISPRRLTIKQIKKKYPLFSQIEEMRYNPNNSKEIQVHCKNHNCSNSKEQGGWFTPTPGQIQARKNQIENENKDHAYFYCSDECKNSCPLYRSNGADPFKDEILPYTSSEYKQFRKYVLERDNYKCQYCGKKAEHVHHERPQKLEPFFALDPDLAWSVCKKCHYEKGHKDECSTGKIANKQCEEYKNDKIFRS
jgi:5-methylcytosine-specific restriction endonuclease McrA